MKRLENMHTKTTWTYFTSKTSLNLMRLGLVLAPSWNYVPDWLRLHFKSTCQTTRPNYSHNRSTDQYAYTWLSLVAEVGGYVGLFLGVLVYQVTNVIDIISKIFIRKLDVPFWFCSYAFCYSESHCITSIDPLWSWKSRQRRLWMIRLYALENNQFPMV